jgi:DNA-directed RNA polymerase alpha subunit
MSVHTLLHAYISASTLSEKIKGDEEAEVALAKVMSALRTLADEPIVANGPTVEVLSEVVRTHEASIQRIDGILQKHRQTSERQASEISAIRKSAFSKEINGLRMGLALEAAHAKASDKVTNTEVFSQEIDEFPLTVRSRNCLQHNNIIYVGDLVQWSSQDLLRTPNFGKKSLREVCESILHPLALDFDMDTHGWQRPLILPD